MTRRYKRGATVLSGAKRRTHDHWMDNEKLGFNPTRQPLHSSTSSLDAPRAHCSVADDDAGHQECIRVCLLHSTICLNTVSAQLYSKHLRLTCDCIGPG
ncbi:hypothetical protein AVEN_239924-1 [Araneus ventricosus]|uniref:Uncharacterized protein n=1 Tax=Araneus ventricosus TaxID=182803 RepID=A0A4Y2WVK9_ARAVE|nr:hypothetical protein AVEN_239924-1 [Araneus ventricosus]